MAAAGPGAAPLGVVACFVQLPTRPCHPHALMAKRTGKPRNGRIGGGGHGGVGAGGVKKDLSDRLAKVRGGGGAERPGGPFGGGGGGKRRNRGGKKRGGGGGRFGGGGNGKKAAPAITNAAQQVLSKVRDGNADDALRLFLKDPHNAVGALPELLDFFSKAGDVNQMERAARAAKGSEIDSAIVLNSMLGIPQGSDPMDCAYLVEAMVRATAWDSLDQETYFLSRMRQVVLEFADEAQKAAAAIGNRDPAFAVKRGTCVMGVRLSAGRRPGEFECGGGQAAFNEESRGLQAGDAVALSAPDGRLEGNLCECEVVVGRPLVIKPLRPDHPFLRGKGSREYRVDKLANRTSFNRMVAAIHLLTLPQNAAQGGGRRSGKRKDEKKQRNLGQKHKPSDHIVAVVVGRSRVADDARLPPKGQDWRLKPRHVDNFNDSQVEALEKALRVSLALVQGPPGTGKTTTALQIMQQWVGASSDILRGKKTALLATSDSNVAVDNLVEGLARLGVRVVRLGRPEMARPELLQYCADEIAAQKCGVKRLSDLKMDQDRKRAREEVHRAIENAEVVCCTSMGAGSGLLNDYTFPKVLMDEASQATEPATVVPICKGCVQLVLLGDHCQLPPTVSSDLATKEGMALSLFERLARAGVRPTLLQVQYRMHPAISAFPRSHFYSGQLSDGIGAIAREPPKGFEWPHRDKPVAVVPVHGKERSEGTSWENEDEARRVVEIVQALLRGGLEPSETGVVTPYGAQARLLRRLLQRAGVKTGRDTGGVEVNSVDSYQGREKEAMVMSTVRANTSGGIGFTADWRRVNVAFTRARRGLIVVCEPQTLSREDRTWAPWLRWAVEEGLCCGRMPSLPPPNPHAKAVGLKSLEVRESISPTRGALGRSRSRSGGDAQPPSPEAPCKTLPRRVADKAAAPRNEGRGGREAGRDAARVTGRSRSRSRQRHRRQEPPERRLKKQRSRSRSRRHRGGDGHHRGRRRRSPSLESESSVPPLPSEESDAGSDGDDSQGDGGGSGGEENESGEYSGSDSGEEDARDLVF